MGDFNPNSTDAVLARILQEVSDIKEGLKEDREQRAKVEGRITRLEHAKWIQHGVTATIGVLSAYAWELWQKMSKP